MIHFVPELAAPDPAGPYAEAVARLASLRNALQLVDPSAAVPEPDPAPAAAWDQAGEARRRCFAARSERTVGAAAAGLDALLAERSAGREPNPQSVERLADEIRDGIADLQRLLGR